MVVFFDAAGAACNWAAFTLLVLFLEEVRRATRHGDPGATKTAVIRLRRCTAILLLVGVSVIVGTFTAAVVASERPSGGKAAQRCEFREAAGLPLQQSGYYLAVAAFECVTCAAFFAVAVRQLWQLRTAPQARHGDRCCSSTLRTALTLCAMGAYLAFRTAGLVAAALDPEGGGGGGAKYLGYYAAEALPSLLLLVATDVGAQVQLVAWNRVGVVPLRLLVPKRQLTLGRMLGEGSFGSVYAASWRGEAVAVKQLRSTAGLPSRQQRRLASQLACEATLMSRLSHPNIVGFLGLCCEERDTPWLLTHLCEGGSLHRLLLPGAEAAGAPPLTWARKAALATGLARGVAYLHSLAPPIIHRDLKPGNCLLDGAGTLKVADFGLSRLIGEAVAQPAGARPVAARAAATAAVIAPTSAALGADGLSGSPPSVMTDALHQSTSIAPPKPVGAGEGAGANGASEVGERSRGGSSHGASSFHTLPIEEPLLPRGSSSGRRSDNSSPQTARAAAYMTLNVGTAQFAAPEVLYLPPEQSEGQEAAAGLPACYTLSADIYSVGVLLWAIAARALPFEGMRIGEAIRAVKRGERPPPIEHASAGWQQVIDACCAHEPGSRPSASELVETLETEPFTARTG